MFPTLKIATLSAVLSAALVSGFAAQGARSTIVPTESAKIYQDRVPTDATGGAPIGFAYASIGTEAAAAGSAARSEIKGDRLRVSPTTACADQAWPHISRDCLAAADGSPVRQVSRAITIEHRGEAAMSTLVKGSALTIATR